MRWSGLSVSRVVQLAVPVGVRPHPLADEVVGQVLAPADLQDVAHVDAVGGDQHHDQGDGEEDHRWR